MILAILTMVAGLPCSGDHAKWAEVDWQIRYASFSVTG